MKNNKLEMTSERVIEEEYSKSRNSYFIYLCHIATYNFAIPYIKNKKVLEFGCGSGYGSNILAGYCKHITAVDISEEAVSYAIDKYKKVNLSFEVIQNIETNPLDFADNTFDVIVSFQVIEHLKSSESYIRELHRVLKNKGTIIIVTPDRKHRLYPLQKPWNMFHVKEFSMKQLSKLISKKFNLLSCLHMSARQDILRMEISRTKKMRFLTLPFTLFFIPEIIRVKLLLFLKKIKKEKSSTQAKKNYGFNVDDVYISENNLGSINLIVVAEKNEGSCSAGY